MTKPAEHIHLVQENAADGNGPSPCQPAGDALRAWLHLANLQFSSRLTAVLLAHFHHDPHAIFTSSDTELDDVPGLQGRHLVRIRDRTLDVTERQWNWFQRHGAWIVQQASRSIPRTARDSRSSSVSVRTRHAFRRGSRKRRHRRVPDATQYGRSVSERIARDLAAQGLTIVSGALLE